MLSIWKGQVYPKARTMREIAENVCEAHGVPMRHLKSPQRLRPIVDARWEAMWQMSQQVREDGRPRYSMAAIGRFFNRDHTTVIHAVQQYSKRNGLVWIRRDAEERDARPAL